MNTFGYNLRLTTFGESHGVAMGGVLDGFPSQYKVDFDFVTQRLRDRAPSSSDETSRHEPDNVEWLSGILDGVTLGTPIAFLIRNTAHRSADYADLTHIYRPSHADLAYFQRYGIRDPRGGGRASGRETVSRVVAGALAEQWLLTEGVSISVEANAGTDGACSVSPYDSIGGTVLCSIKGVKPGIGNPVFGKLQSRLADAILSIPACHSFSYGAPVETRPATSLPNYRAPVETRPATSLPNYRAPVETRPATSLPYVLGSQYNDPMEYRDGTLHYLSNNAGGILGGISTGEEIYFRASFKPTPSIALPQHTVTDDGQNIELTIKGRHDRCIVRRAAAVVRAMTALTIMDFYL